MATLSNVPQHYPIKKNRGPFSPGWTTTLFDGSDCERLAEYRSGGLCPVLIGDVLSGPDLIQEGEMCSFEVVGKLGRGSYSTVWLARHRASGKYLAIKVLKSEHSTPDNSEMRILRELGQLQSAFFHTHYPTEKQFLCLGVKPMGSSLSERIDAVICLPDDTTSITALVKKLVTTVLSFHRQGICHGDISPSNVALGVQDSTFTQEALDATFGDDRKSYIKLSGVSESEMTTPRPAGLPEYVVRREGPPLLTNTKDLSKVDIIDFGKAFKAPSKANVFGTALYRAPEVDRDGYNITTFKSDLWSTGCVIVYALINDHLFWLDETTTKYTGANDEGQLSIIESHIQMNECMKKHPTYRRLLARLIQSLLRINPAARDGERARSIIGQLESYDSSPSSQN